jgi:2-dehydro-3-deoxyphosphogluconate aldolase / (4S)-4-hydroxy-2-oxoglutarate aldolase
VTIGGTAVAPHRRRSTRKVFRTGRRRLLLAAPSISTPAGVAGLTRRMVMTADEVLGLVGSGRLVIILRGDFRGSEVEIVGTLADAGIVAVEVTLNSPGAFESIGVLAAEFGARMAVGAGTVLRPNDVDRALDAGARFIVSPNRDVAVIERTKRLGLVSFPGCFTPSEIVEAVDAGADAVKLFPARMIEPGVVSDLRGPLNDVRMIPTGGVVPERVQAYLEAGAWALGVGSTLIDRSVMQPGGIERLGERSAAFVHAVRGYSPAVS